MITKGTWIGLSLVAAILLALVIGQMLVTASVREEANAAGDQGAGSESRIVTQAVLVEPRPGTAGIAPGKPTLSSQEALADESPSSRSLLALDGVSEVFSNTWSYSTIGLVYDPGRDRVRYGHESQSSNHNPTVYDVDRASPHPVLGSFALSTVNSSWPWQIDNRDGAGYDFVRDTYYLPDYNGDLSFSDDNIVEVNAAGVILNAWEMDDEVGSNDSSDGSEIDSIIDIAVVPGTPTRYFVTAAYDGSVVYEVALTRTGVWWTPNSWHTVATYTLPVFSDNLGIDWDAEHEVLFHSGWHTTTILMTDLGMNPVTQVDATFDCPGAGGYNSGVTYIEGSDPTEIWVTDFSSDATTRCGTPFTKETLPPAWGKWVAAQPWAPGLSIETQTADVFLVSDVITAVQAFTLTETWDPAHLELLDAEVIPPLGTVVTGTGSLQIAIPAGPPEVVVVEKRFFVKPCDWTSTLLEESLVVKGVPAFEPRPVTIEKLPPALGISSTHEGEAYPGGLAAFALNYSNAGGYETDVKIQATFPVTAPFVFADPLPDDVAPDGTWVRWGLGDLARDDTGQIEVYGLIAETVPPSNTVRIGAGIFDHIDQQREEIEVAFHVAEPVSQVAWEKMINGEPWQPGVALTLETSQTLEVQDLFIPEEGSELGFQLLEEWNPDELALVGWEILPESYAQYVEDSVPGVWILTAPETPDPVQVTVVKSFHVEPCTWPETVLWEGLQVGGAVRNRPVVVGKRQPQLWLDSLSEPTVHSGQVTGYELAYGNAGGLETWAWIKSTFSPEATFAESQPAPSAVGPEGMWAVWEVGPLEDGTEGGIAVTVEIAPALPPSTTIGIWSGIFNHVDEVVDETEVVYHVPPPEWTKWVNGEEWTPGLGVSVWTSDTLTVTDVIASSSAPALVEHWNPKHLRLDSYSRDPVAGIVLSETGSLSWEFPMGAPEIITLTKVFHVEPLAWDYTVLWEELWVEGEEWERRPVEIDKRPTYLVYLPLVMRGH